MTLTIDEFSTYQTREENRLRIGTLGVPSATQQLTPSTSPVVSTALTGPIMKVQSDTPVLITVGTGTTCIRAPNWGPASSRLLPHRNPIWIWTRPSYFLVAAGDTVTVAAQAQVAAVTPTAPAP